MIKLLFTLILSSFVILNHNENKPVIIYVNDPLCSWCYGFSPIISKIKDKYKTVADFRLVEGGLRPDSKDPMTEELKSSLKEHWEEINEQTGQPFNYEILKSNEFVYNTEVPCRAVVAFRKLKPDSAFDFLKAIQNAFYVKNKNTNSLQTYLELLPGFNVDEKEFTKIFQSEEVKAETRKDFELTETAGIAGFPAIILKKDGKFKIITAGYDSYSKLEKKLDKELLN
jgi:putative protein-disulfide isomerase